MQLVPHHDGSALYVSTQSPALGDRVRVRVRVPQSFGDVAAVHVRSNPNAEPRYSVASRVASLDGWDWWEAEVEIENLEHRYRFLIRLGDGTLAWVNATGVHSIETLDAEDFVLLAHPAPPDWAASTVMYQIFPDRFARSRAADARPVPTWAKPAKWSDEPIHIGPDTPVQFYGGDLGGIVEHLDHLERLGVTMIYLTPFFPAESNHRYNAFSFDHVDPLLGGDDALVDLVEAAHARGFRVIGDLTSNHSGDVHEWFQRALADPTAVERDFYYWHEQTDHTLAPDYVSWLGVPTLPKFNWASQELRNRFIEGENSVVAKWLQPPFNLDGWRIDVANMTGRYLDDDFNEEVRRIIRRTMIDVNPDTLLVAEATNDASGDFRGDGWHGAMTYANFTRPVWGWLSRGKVNNFFGVPVTEIPQYSGHEVVETHVRFTAGFPWRVRTHNLNALDTHDTPRFLTNALPGTVPVAFGMSVTLPGIPVVWAGDELGLVGDDGEHSRTAIPWETIDEATDAIDLYASLIRLRRDHVALAEGGMRWLHVDDDVLVYVREHADESVLVVAARADFDVALDLGVSEASVLYGEASFEGGRLQGSGPSFTAWKLPGVGLPPFAQPGTVLELEEVEVLVD